MFDLVFDYVTLVLLVCLLIWLVFGLFIPLFCLIVLCLICVVGLLLLVVVACVVLLVVACVLLLCLGAWLVCFGLIARLWVGLVVGVLWFCLGVVVCDFILLFWVVVGCDSVCVCWFVVLVFLLLVSAVGL